MGNLGDRYLWRPRPRGTIYIRLTYRLPGDSKLHRFVKSLATTSYPEARRIRDRAFAPLLTSLRCAHTAHDAARFIIRSAEGVLDRDLSLFLDGLGVTAAEKATLPPAAHAAAPAQSSPKTSNGLTWGTLSEKYMNHVRARKARSTAMRYRVQVDVLDEFFGKNTHVRDVDRRMVASLLELLEQQGKLADTTINVTIARVGAIFRFGKTRGLVDGQVTWEAPDPPAVERRATSTEPRLTNAPTRRRVRGRTRGRSRRSFRTGVGRARGEPERRPTGQGSRRAA